jgi:hypothetical protein
VRWKWGLLACLGAASLAVSGVSAAPSADVFLLTLSGTASAQWDHTSAPTPADGCTKTERTEGIRTVRFRSRATRVRIVNGRLVAVDVGGLHGSVKLSGAETTETTCPGGEGSSQISDCIISTRSFSGGVVRLSSPVRGRLALGPIRGVRLAVAECPDEVAAVRREPAGMSPGPIRLPLEKLTNPRTLRVTTHFSNRREDPFEPPESGSIAQRAAWTLTFKRVGAP